MADDDWRERYLKLTENNQLEEQRVKEAERDLIRLIGRLCVAAKGFDSQLDPHLSSLRKVVKSGYSAKVKDQVNAIGDAIAKIGDQAASTDFLPLLLKRAKFPAKKIKSINALWKKLEKSPDTLKASQLDDLAGLFGWHHVDGEPTGLFGRLLGKKEEKVTAVSPNQLLRSVLDGFKWPVSVQASITPITHDLASSDDDDAWLGVVERVNGLVVSAMQEAQQNAAIAEEFLSSLSQRLATIDNNLAKVSTHSSASAVMGKQLGEKIDQEVGSLSDNVRNSTDSSQLRDDVLDSLGRMQRHVIEHLQHETQQREVVEKQNKQLRADIKKLENRSFDLQRKISESQLEAMQDQLTGLANRRAYDARMKQEYARWRRFSEPLAVLVWDIDNFKAVNDTFGHKAGDRVLQLIAKKLKKKTRETDFIARYGGEEIVVILTGAAIGDLKRIAEEMRASVESAAMHSNKKPVKVTVSGGLSLFMQGDTVESAFERADKAMYQAKNSGKNRVVVG